MIAAIDPGLGGTGVALFGDDPYPLTVRSINTKETHVLGIQDMSSKLYHVFKDFQDTNRSPEKVYLEWPIWMGANAAAKSGDLITLSALVGSFMRTLTSSNYLIVQPVPVRDWKGDASKKATVGWVKSILDIKDDKHWKNSHAWDAVGIGLWAKGLL